MEIKIQPLRLPNPCAYAFVTPSQWACVLYCKAMSPGLMERIWSLTITLSRLHPSNTLSVGVSCHDLTFNDEAFSWPNTVSDTLKGHFRTSPQHPVILVILPT